MFTALAAILLAPAADTLFVATSPAEARPVGKLLALSLDGADLDTSQGKTTVAGAFSLRRTNIPLPALPRGPALFTTTGDRVAGELIGGDGQSLRFQPSMRTPEWKVPISSAAVVWLSKPPADTPTDIGRYGWLPENRRRDVLLFRNGDTLRGTLDGFTREPKAFKFAPEVGAARMVAFDESAAIAFNPTLARARKPKV